MPRRTPRPRCRCLQLVPNLVTILGLCAGLTALRFAFAGRFEAAAALIVFAALLDGFDGLLARRLDAASRVRRRARLARRLLQLRGGAGASSSTSWR